MRRGISTRLWPVRTGARQVDPIPQHVGTGRLRGRRALVAGGFTGEGRLGPLVAAALAKEGAAVAVADSTKACSDRPASVSLRSVGTAAPPATVPHTAAGVLATVGLLAELGAHTLPLECDLTVERDCRGTVARTALEFGGIDLLVVCGDAVPPRERLVDLTTRSLEQSLRGSVYGAFWLTQAASVYMQDGAAVVLTGSAAGRSGAPERIGHAVGAAGVMTLASSLAAPMRERGVAINCLVSDGLDDPYRTAETYVDLATADPARETGAILPVPSPRRSAS